MDPGTSSKETNLDVAIIGGGLAGISCALALADSGLRIAVFERGRALGGRAGSFTEPTSGTTIDIGPHIFLSEYRNMLDMLRPLGTESEVVWQTDRFINLLDGPHRIPMRVHPLPAPLHLLPSLLRVGGLSMKDKASNARITWLAMRAHEQHRLHLDDISALDLLREYGVSERLQRWFWATATLALLNVPLHECSAAALLRMYAQLIGTSGYRSGFATKPLADLFVPAATSQLRKQGVHIEPGIEVVRLHATDNRVQAIELSDGRHLTTRACVATVPPAELRALLKHSGMTNTQWDQRLRSFEPCPYISTYLWFDRKITNERFWGRVWSPTDLNCDFYDLSNIRTDIDNHRSLIASNCIYCEAHQHLSDDDVVSRTLAELIEFEPSARNARLVHAVVNRIPMAIPCPKPGTETARLGAATNVNGFFLAGDWTNTHMPSCMESAVYSGRIAAECILRGQKCRHSAAIPPPQPTGFVKLAQRFPPRKQPLVARFENASSVRTRP